MAKLYYELLVLQVLIETHIGKDILIKLSEVKVKGHTLYMCEVISKSPQLIFYNHKQEAINDVKQWTEVEMAVFEDTE